MSHQPLVSHPHRVAPFPLGAGRGVLRAAGLPLLLCGFGVVALASSPAAPATTAHKVVNGDTLWALAQQSGTSVVSLQRLNHLTGVTIQLGQTLQLPTSGAGTAAGTAGGGAAGTLISHVVVTGDTLSALATRSGATQAQLRQLNPTVPASGTIVLGQVLQLPGGPAEATGAAPSAPGNASYPVAVLRSRALLSTRSLPGQTQVSAWIRAEALRQGVPVSLALAISWQESGWSQGVVSPTDAVGVMQLEPDTVAWASTSLVGRTLDRYDAHDNIVAGVAVLHSLLSVTDTRTAVAAYYEGLAAVRAKGLFTDTKSYVASVLALQQRFS